MKDERMMTYEERREHMLRTDPEFIAWVEEMEREGEDEARRNVVVSAQRAAVIAVCMTAALIALAITFSLIVMGGGR